MKKVLLLLADGFETFEASVFIDVIGWNLVEGDKSTKLFTCGLRKELKSSFNQRFIMDYTVNEIDVNSFDALAIPGGFEVYGFYQDAYSDTFLDLIRTFKSQNKMIASICVGALPIGKSGILKGKNGTVYNSEIRREALKGFGVNVIHQPIVMDDNVITSWNPSTAVDVAFLLLEHLTTKNNADNIRRLMGFTAMNKIDTILFDLGGVLVDFDREKAVKAFEELGYHEAGELLDPYLQSGIFLRLEDGSATVDEFHDYVRSQASTEATDERIDAVLHGFMTGIPQYKLDMLLELRKCFRICMLSNTNAIIFPYAVRECFSRDGYTLSDYFDRCFLSYELGAVKPSPKIFTKIIEQGINPSRTLFIDDSPANIEQASKMGFSTYLAVEGEDFRHIFKGL